MKQSSLLLISLLFLLIACSDDDSPVTIPSISVSDSEITESDNDVNLTLTVSLSSPSDAEVSVQAETRTSTATEDDYTPISTTLVFSPGQTSLSVDITIKGDNQVEDDERFLVLLTQPSSNATLGNDRAVITILNDDFLVASDLYDGMGLAWEENFDGSSVNEEIWTFDNGDGCDQGLCGWGNNELQIYAKENTTVADGILTIEALSDANGNYTSSKLISKHKQNFRYGRIDVRAKMPYGKGLWPAIWMLGANIDDVSWPACGEIDIMEMIGGGENDKITHGTVHWESDNGYANFSGKKTKEGGKLSDDFHLYSIEWDENKIAWYFDNVQYHFIDLSPSHLSEFKKDFYMILNVAVGGNWPGSPDASTTFPQTMQVDYIKHYQKL